MHNISFITLFLASRFSVKEHSLGKHYTFLLNFVAPIIPTIFIVKLNRETIGIPCKGMNTKLITQSCMVYIA